MLPERPIVTEYMAAADLWVTIGSTVAGCKGLPPPYAAETSPTDGVTAAPAELMLPSLFAHRFASRAARSSVRGIQLGGSSARDAIVVIRHPI